jgi:hypothetical protein
LAELNANVIAHWSNLGLPFLTPNESLALALVPIGQLVVVVQSGSILASEPLGPIHVNSLKVRL